MSNWIEKDLQYLWHPYTQMKDCLTNPPILIEKAKGIKLFDDKGNFYYDTIASWWCNVHGHNHPKIKTAIKKQLDKFEHVLFAGFTHKPAITLAQKLTEITPQSLTRVFYTDNGSCAVEAALKLSFQYWQNVGKKTKTKFLSLESGFHGDTLGAMSVSGIDQFNAVFSPMFFDSFKVPCPNCYRCPMGKDRDSCNLQCTEPIEQILKTNHDEIAAMILEPLLMAAAGMIVYPKEYLQKVAQLTKKYNVHLILDEVATGFGRTGQMFACQHANVSPDFMCLSKGITSGYLPFAATLTTDEIYSAFYDDYKTAKAFMHGHTYTANPLGCAAAIASLQLFEDENTLEKLQEKIHILQKGVERTSDFPYVGNVRGIGMAWAIEIVKDKKTKATFPAERRIGIEIYKKGLEKNLLLRPLGNIIYLFPPLCITKPQLNYVLKNLRQIINDIQP